MNITANESLGHLFGSSIGNPSPLSPRLWRCSCGAVSPVKWSPHVTPLETYDAFSRHLKWHGIEPRPLSHDGRRIDYGGTRDHHVL